jgi:hypothetical protein
MTHVMMGLPLWMCGMSEGAWWNDAVPCSSARAPPRPCPRTHAQRIMLYNALMEIGSALWGKVL